MEGQLKRKMPRGGLLGDLWADRYFVLDARTLRFFARGSAEGTPEGEVRVAGFDAREELQGRAKGRKPHRLDFDLEGGGVLCVSAPSAAERQQWMDAVAAATGGGAAMGGGGGGNSSAAAAASPTAPPPPPPPTR